MPREPVLRKVIVNRRIEPQYWNHGKHNFRPEEYSVAQKLGLNKKDKIHFFNVFSGEWAKAIADKVQLLDASDITEYQTSKLKQDKGKINRISNLPAEMHNNVPEYYDWSISYEPFPIYHSRVLDAVFRVGLLNKKGMKFIFSMMHETQYYQFVYELERFSEIFGVKINRAFTTIDIQKSNQQSPEPFVVITIETNPIARKNAELDIYVERQISKLKNLKDITHDKILAIAKMLNVTPENIIDSIERILICEAS